jgi:hypothetical protein
VLFCFLSLSLCVRRVALCVFACECSMTLLWPLRCPARSVLSDHAERSRCPFMGQRRHREGKHKRVEHRHSGRKHARQQAQQHADGGAAAAASASAGVVPPSASAAAPSPSVCPPLRATDLVKKLHNFEAWLHDCIIRLYLQPNQRVAEVRQQGGRRAERRLCGSAAVAASGELRDRWSGD